MARSRGMTSHGFNFYLVVSLGVHVVLMVCVSAVSFPAPRRQQEEVIPVKIKTRPEIEPRAAASGEGDFLRPAEDIVETSSSAALRRRTRLPASFRRAPRPPAGEKGTGLKTLSRRATDRRLVGSFQPDLGSLPRKIDFGKNIAESGAGETQATERPPQRELEIVTEKPEAQFMELPRERETEAAEPQIRSRPAFPYSELRPVLPQNHVKVALELRLEKSGQVAEVTVIESSGEKKLDRGIKGWVKNWRYHPRDSVTVTEVTVEIPGL